MDRIQYAWPPVSSLDPNYPHITSAPQDRSGTHSPGENIHGTGSVADPYVFIIMFLGLLDQDPLVRGTDPDPDPSFIKKKKLKNLSVFLLKKKS
jgi:hypothetical protein